MANKFNKLDEIDKSLGNQNFKNGYKNRKSFQTKWIHKQQIPHTKKNSDNILSQKKS